jgi:hypothetical protein
MDIGLIEWGKTKQNILKPINNVAVTIVKIADRYNILDKMDAIINADIIKVCVWGSKNVYA